MLSRRLLLVLVSAVLVISTLACGLPSIFGSKADPTATTAPTNTAVAPTATEAAAAVATQPEAAATKAETAPTQAQAQAEPTASGAEVKTEEPLEVSTSLENVDTYSAVMTMTYLGLGEAEDQSATMTITQSVDRTNKAESYSIEGTDEDGNPISMQVITIGEDSWMSFGEGWMHTKSDDSSGMTMVDDELLSQGSQILDGIESPRLIESGVVVNGIVCDHYAWDESDLKELAAEGTASGEVWISQQDDLLIKMIVHASGDMMGADSNGTVDVTWEILSLNEPVVIEPPEAMSAESMLPVMEGASSENYLSSSDMAMYEIESTMEDVVAWYDGVLEADGYIKDSEDFMEGMASATYTRDDTTVNLLVTESDTEGMVSVIVTK